MKVTKQFCMPETENDSLTFPFIRQLNEATGRLWPGRTVHPVSGPFPTATYS